MAAQWCEVHEVYDRCAEPKPSKSKVVSAHRGGFRRGPITRTAEFDSHCPACLEMIFEGDDIAWSAEVDGYVHEECL